MWLLENFTLRMFFIIHSLNGKTVLPYWSQVALGESPKGLFALGQSCRED